MTKTVHLRRRILSVLMIAAVVFSSVFVFPSASYGMEIDYTKQANRYAQNQKMFQQCSELNIELYQDKYLGDLVETRRVPLTEEEQQQIQTLGEEILREGSPWWRNLSDLEKLNLFHNWITEHFWYYSGEGVKQNPAELYQMYLEDDGRIRTWCNGYAAMLVAFARSQGIPATIVGGHYIRTLSALTVQKADASWTARAEIRPLTDRTHWWAIAYVLKDGKRQWVQIDCNADCYNSFSTGDWVSSKPETKKKYGQKLFAPSLSDFSRTHIIWSIRRGSRQLQYFYNQEEKQQLLNFLEYEEDGVSNGVKVSGQSYSPDDQVTWFSSETKSEADGAGLLYRLYFPEFRDISGVLELQDFERLRNVKISRNEITGLNLRNCPGLVTVAAVDCNVEKAEITGSSQMTLLNLKGNPLKEVKYTYRGNKTARLTAADHGTIQVCYFINNAGKTRHRLIATADKGYVFKGWYNGNKKVSSKSNFLSTRASSFHYTAKFEKKQTKKTVTKKTTVKTSSGVVSTK